MKLKLLIASVVVVGIAILADTSHFAFGNANGAPAGVTGSPGNGGITCNTAGCHTGNAVVNSPGWITSNIPGAGYTPGTTYTVTATAVAPTRNTFGFEISPQDLVGNYMGTLINGGPQTQIIGTKYITHTNGGNSGSGSKTWTFTWTAPPSGSGTLTFYGAFNCANGDTQNTGDSIHTSTLTVNEAPTPGTDCGIFKIIFPSLFACSSTLTPIVQLDNFGNTTLTSCTINYFIDSNSPSTFSWTGNLASQTSIQVTLPGIPVTAGAHTFTAHTSNPNGGSDAMASNDSKTGSFTANFTPATLPFVEGFESATFPPAGWFRKNPDNQTTWARTTSAHVGGSASMFMDNFNYQGNGQIDEMYTPLLNLSSASSPALAFQVAYALYTSPSSNPNYSDTLSIFISTDCGLTWTQLYKKYSTNLTTRTPPNTLSLFVPNANQWRYEFIDLSPYASSNGAIIKFVNTNDFENELYIDDINIGNLTGIASLNDNFSLDVFPNPSSDMVTISYNLPAYSPVSVSVYDITGKTVATPVSSGNISGGHYTAMLDVKDFAPGIYFMRLVAGKDVVTKKFVVTR